MSKSNLTFNAEEILMIIQNELMTIMENNGYNQMGYDIKISLERQFIRREEFDPKTIYVVVKFNEAELNYGQLVAPFTITAVTEENCIDISYQLFLEFSEKYNLKMSDDGTILQAYTSPTMNNSFQYVASGYRPSLYMSGTFLISKNINRMSFEYVEHSLKSLNGLEIEISNIGLFLTELNNIYYELEEKGNEIVDKWKFWITVSGDNIYIYITCKENNVEFSLDLSEHLLKYISLLSTPEDGRYDFEIDLVEHSLNELTRSLNTNIDLDTQAFYNTNNYTKSEAKLGTLSFNVSMNLLSDNKFCNKCLDILSKKDGINNSFIMKIVFSGSEHSFYDVFKIMTINIQENVAALPLISVAMTN